MFAAFKKLLRAIREVAHGLVAIYSSCGPINAVSLHSRAFVVQDDLQGRSSGLKIALVVLVSEG